MSYTSEELDKIVRRRFECAPARGLLPKLLVYHEDNGQDVLNRRLGRKSRPQKALQIMCKFEGANLREQIMNQNSTQPHMTEERAERMCCGLSATHCPLLKSRGFQRLVDLNDQLQETVELSFEVTRHAKGSQLELHGTSGLNLSRCHPDSSPADGGCCVDQNLAAVLSSSL